MGGDTYFILTTHQPVSLSLRPDERARPRSPSIGRRTPRPRGSATPARLVLWSLDRRLRKRLMEKLSLGREGWWCSRQRGGMEGRPRGSPPEGWKAQQGHAHDNCSVASRLSRLVYRHSYRSVCGVFTAAGHPDPHPHSATGLHCMAPSAPQERESAQASHLHGPLTECTSVLASCDRDCRSCGSLGLPVSLLCGPPSSGVSVDLSLYLMSHAWMWWWC